MNQTSLDKLLQAELAERKPDPLYGQPQTRSILPDAVPDWVWCMVAGIVLFLAIIRF
jgi:hypothetical protein